MVNGEIGTRVRERLRQMYPGKTQEEVAESVGISPDAFSRALNGKRGFASIELARLAELLSTSMYWLATGSRDPTEPTVVARHHFDPVSLTRSVNWAELQGVVSDVRLAYDQAQTHHLAHLGETSPAALPADASLVREALGADFTRNFADDLETKFGIEVIRVPGVSTAVAMRIGEKSVIVLGETGNWFYQNWSLAHELGHLALSHANADPSAAIARHVVDRQELDANAFAAELLLPAKEMYEVDWLTVQLQDVAQKIWDWGVSTDALNRRLKALRLEVSPVVASALILKTQAMLRRHWNGSGAIDAITERMNDASSRRFPSRLQAAHLEAIGAGHAPKATLAWMLGIDESELEVDAPQPLHEEGLDALASDLGFKIGP